MNIVLIGYRGAGKSVVGRLLAKRLGMEYIGMDSAIVERAGMPIPETLPAVPGASAIPWWTGVPGLDPDCRAHNDTWAAQATAMACAAHVFGASAGYAADWWRSQKAAPAAKWLRWLVGHRGEGDAFMRRLALRLICERAASIPADQILDVIEMLYKACDPPAR